MQRSCDWFHSVTCGRQGVEGDPVSGTWGLNSEVVPGLMTFCLHRLHRSPRRPRACFLITFIFFLRVVMPVLPR